VPIQFACDSLWKRLCAFRCRRSGKPRRHSLPWLAGLIAGLVWSLASAAQEAVPAGAEPRQPLGAYLGLLDDPGGTLDLAAALNAARAGKFRALPGATSGLGHHRSGALWAQFTLFNPAPVSQNLWLEANRPFQPSYTLYLVDAQGRHESMDSGARMPVGERPLPSRHILFPVRLEPGERKTALLRVAGRADWAVDLTLWHPAAYFDHRNFWAALKYLGVGCTAIVSVFGLLAWRARRQPGLLAIIPGHGLILLAVLWNDGFAGEWMPADDGFWYSRGLCAVAGLVACCHLVFARAFLGLARRAPRRDRALRLLIVLSGATAVTALFVEGVFDPVPWGCIPLAVTGVLSGMAVLAARRPSPPGFCCFAAWGGLWLALVASAIGFLGGWPDTVASPDFWMFGLWVSGPAITCALYLDIEAARAEWLAAQARLLALEQGDAERLARAVEVRTEELRQATERAESANRAKSAILSTVSHEFRTPLHTILGFAQILGQRAEGDFSAKLAVIERSGAQLLRLIDDVLDFSQGESQRITLQPEPLDLRTLAYYLREASRILAEKNGNRFTVSLGSDLPAAVEADERRLTQVLLNLIGNACKYTRNGRIRLHITAGEPGPEGRRDLRFEVEDTGTGILPEDRDSIFEPFGRGADSGCQPGVGLGLAIARQLVRAMGGDIDFTSEPGRGSRFFFTLRLKETEAGAAESRPQQGRILGYAGPRLTLLIADDVAVNREFLKALCTRWGFRVLLASDGEEAATLCRAAGVRIDAALIDQFMPHADGWMFLKTIRVLPEFEQLPVVLVSAALPQRPPDFPAGVDFDDVLIKPVTLNSLADSLQRLLAVEWLREMPPEAAESIPRTARPVVPSPAKLAEFRTMLALGQVIVLQRWADALAASDPECAAFAAEVKRLSQAIDLQGLQRLLEKASTVSAAENGSEAVAGLMGQGA
jgi:signal transduction histidine kinase/CheY-like chemotaxis protein